MLMHIAQFYEDDESYCSMHASFLDAALRAGDTGVVFATAVHLQALQAALARLQSERTTASSAALGHCVMLDAEPLLSGFMVNGRLDESLFREGMAGLIAQHVPADSRRIWVFGEFVGLLVVQGKPEEALRLEACWAGLVNANRQYNFSTVCAYPQHVLDQDGCRHWVPAICRAHTGVSLPR